MIIVAITFLNIPLIVIPFLGSGLNTNLVISILANKINIIGTITHIILNILYKRVKLLAIA